MVARQNRGPYAGLPCSIAYSYQDSKTRPVPNIRFRTLP